MCCRHEQNANKSIVIPAEQIKARSGWLELNQLQLESFQRGEHLVFTAISDDGDILDRDACKQLFTLGGTITGNRINGNAVPAGLQETVRRQLDAALNKALEENDAYFRIEREKLEAWAEDQIKSAEQQLQDTKLQMRDTKRKARQAQSIEEEKQFLEEQLEKQQRRQRQEIWDVEDAIEAKRDQMIEALEKHLHQKSSSHHLFRIRWLLVYEKNSRKSGKIAGKYKII